jgi:plasmid stabilization system protein ParE
VSFSVHYSQAARDDLKRLYEYLLDHCETMDDLVRADAALSAIESAAQSLAQTPFIYRKAARSPFLRELLIPFGNSGYVMLFEIENVTHVSVLAVRHQLEDDYH